MTDRTPYEQRIIDLRSLDWQMWFNQPNVIPQNIRENTQTMDDLIQQTADWSDWFDLNHLHPNFPNQPGCYIIAESYYPTKYERPTRIRRTTPLPVHHVKYVGRSRKLANRIISYRRATDIARPPIHQVVQLAVKDEPEVAMDFLLSDRKTKQAMARGWLTTRNFWFRFCFTSTIEHAAQVEELVIRHYLSRGAILWNSLKYPNSLVAPPPLDTSWEEYL